MGHEGRVAKRNLKSGRVVWRFEIDTKDPGSGKRRRVIRQGFATQRDARKAMREFLNDQTLGVDPKGGAATLGEWMATVWLPAARMSVRPTTHRLYETIVRAYIVPHVGAVSVGEMSPGHISQLYGRLSEQGLAPKTIRNVHNLLHRAFRDAVRWGLRAANPVDAVDPPRVPSSRPATWSTDELRTFLEYIRGSRLEALWRVLVTTGMRRGEALGLTWSEVDLAAGVVSVSRQLVDEGGGRIALTDPKTASGRRTVSLDAATLASLRDHRHSQLEERLAWGRAYLDWDLVFCREDGSPIRPAWITRRLPRLAEAAGLPRLTPHGLRHTWATIGLQAHVHPKVVADRLGHSSVRTTLDTYSHVVEGLDQQAAELVAGVIDGNGTEVTREVSKPGVANRH